LSKLYMYGASDDLVEFEGHANGEVGCYASAVRVEIGAGDGLLIVQFEYAGEKGWVLSTWMPHGIEEDEWTPPAMIVTTARERRSPYSPLVEVDVPDGAAIRCWVDGAATKIA